MAKRGQKAKWGQSFPLIFATQFLFNCYFCEIQCGVILFDIDFFDPPPFDIYG